MIYKKQKSKLIQFFWMLKTIFVGNSYVEINSQCKRLPTAGETLKGHKVSKRYSGKAINSSIQFNFLSDPKYHPELLTCIGNDNEGVNISNFLAKNKITAHLVKNEKESTGTKINIKVAGGDTSSVFHPCNFSYDLMKNHIDKITSSQILVTSFELPFECLVEILKSAKQNNLKTILRASPLPENQDFDMDFLQYVTVLILNESEAPTFGTVKSLLNRGIECIIITYGADGATFYEQGKRVGMTVASPVVKVADTVGAGDSFLGTFAFCLANKMSYEDSSRIACGAATISVQKEGLIESFPKMGNPDLMPLF
ncbi:kinase, pfkB family protein [Tritrichomonas foetus]|uniref:Kinase, pfkB family protein n=1 Tax=Tritrichomonas foetus TaxID=1144522 RepID=A0A1J4JHX5_9EUKA|nr:kinase, pfkB family protein [Tritrichomonas foetus]|eukprot:OHS97211.1 kinase, pfkB family protein [Tritrichomonas foetus]